MFLINFLVSLYVTGVATNWLEEVRDSLIPPATVRWSFAQGNQLPYPLRLDSLLGIRVGGHFSLSLSVSLNKYYYFDGTLSMCFRRKITHVMNLLVRDIHSISKPALTIAYLKSKLLGYKRILSGKWVVIFDFFFFFCFFFWVAWLQKGWVYREHHKSPGYYDGRYWTMWKLPMYGCTDATQVLKEVGEVQKEYPHSFVRIIGFDNKRQVQCISFIAAKPPGV